jgi:hypothetical protein
MIMLVDVNIAIEAGAIDGKPNSPRIDECLCNNFGLEFL